MLVLTKRAVGSGAPLGQHQNRPPQFLRLKAAVAAVGPGAAAETLSLTPPDAAQSASSSTRWSWWPTGRTTSRYLRVALVSLLISVIYGTSGIIVRSAYDELLSQSARVRPTITAPDVKLTATQDERRQDAVLPDRDRDQSAQPAADLRQAEPSPAASEVVAARVQEPIGDPARSPAASTSVLPSEPPEPPPAAGVAQPSSAALDEPAAPSTPASSASPAIPSERVAGASAEPDTSARPLPSLKPLNAIPALASADPIALPMGSGWSEASARINPPTVTFKPAADPESAASVKPAASSAKNDTLAEVFQGFFSNLGRLLATRSPPAMVGDADHGNGNDFAQTGFRGTTSNAGSGGNGSASSTTSGSNAAGAKSSGPASNGPGGGNGGSNGGSASSGGSSGSGGGSSGSSGGSSSGGSSGGSGSSDSASSGGSSAGGGGGGKGGNDKGGGGKGNGNGGGKGGNGNGGGKGGNDKGGGGGKGHK